jgi:hypothetical protein
MTYLGDAAGELSVDQLRYHGLLPAKPTRKDNTMTRTENERLAIAANVRGEHATQEALYEMEKLILGTIGIIEAGSRNFPASEIAEALSDRELLTLELWAGEEHKAITDEVTRRRAEYEKFTRRFGEHVKS